MAVLPLDAYYKSFSGYLGKAFDYGKIRRIVLGGE